MAQSNDIWTITAALDWTTGYLARKGDASPRVSAQRLMAHACGLSRIELYTNLERPLSQNERAVLRDYVKRRGEGEPLQYIVGEVGFRFLTLEVARGVLIPRPETEVLVSVLLQMLPEAEEGSMLRIADVGCGSGCIACSVASERPDTHVYALDIAPDALDLCQRNAERCGVADRVTVLESDMLSGLDEALYGALDGGEDGLDAFRALLEVAPIMLKPHGILAVELHEECLDAAADLAREAGLVDVCVHQDLAGKPRILTALRA